MELQTSLDLALMNLTAPPVLAFVLGVLATGLVRTDLRLPGAVYQALSMYLLLAIGLKGGVALRDSEASDVVLPAIMAALLGVLLPLGAYAALGRLTRCSPLDRGALAAHYGSTSLVTFMAALTLLETAQIAVEGYVATLLAIMEVPGIIVGLMLARIRSTKDPRDDEHLESRWREALREVVTGPSVILLFGGLVIGLATGASGYAKVEPLFSGLFTGVLTLFLLHLGCVASGRLRDIRAAGFGIVGFALVFPLVAGGAGIAAGTIVGMSAGGAAVLGVLSASASYIAAPAAVSLALPKANEGLSLTASLGITFPFNLLVTVPLLVAVASRLG